MSIKRIQREFSVVEKDPIPNVFNIGPVGENWFEWQVAILGPEDTPYAGGVFFVDISFPTNYSFERPKLTFATKIFHPMIHPERNSFCQYHLCILGENWNPAVTIGRIMTKVVSLLQLEIEEDELCDGTGESYKLYREDREEFTRKAREWTDHKRDTDGKMVYIDQLAKIIEQIKSSPDSRRLIVSAWNPADIDEMAKAGLPPCHCLFQFKVLNGKISLQLYQRSCDTFLGVPFNIASYSLLLMMVAQATGYTPHEFIWTGGDTHIYSNHFDQVKEQLSRDFRKLPTVKINPEIKDLFDFKMEDFELVGYEPHDAIKAPIAV